MKNKTIIIPGIIILAIILATSTLAIGYNVYDPNKYCTRHYQALHYIQFCKDTHTNYNLMCIAEELKHG